MPKFQSHSTTFHSGAFSFSESHSIRATNPGRNEYFDILDIENEFNLNDDNFRCELDYDGYQNIEDYDDALYNSCRLEKLGAAPLDMGTLE